MQTYIHIFTLAGSHTGSYPFNELPDTVKTAECEFCPCLLAGDIAKWLADQYATLKMFTRAPAPFQRFIMGSFTAGPLAGLFFTSSKRTHHGLLEGGPRAASQLWIGLEREGKPWTPEPIFEDGDPHHA